MKKWLTLVLALALMLSLAACGGGSEGGATPTPEATEDVTPTEAPSEQSEPPAPEETPAAPAPVELEISAETNPLVGFDGDGNLTYGGDPAALVVDDTLYLYVGHDVATNEAYNIPEYLCYSTKDLQNWTYEGVALSMADVSWGTKDAAWASQCARHYSEAEGKDMYYLYTCSWDTTDSGKQSIGVAVSDSPTGPFVDIGAPIVKGSFTTDETSGWNDIDPTVWIETDEDGEEHRYLCWGNGKVYICELNEDMVSVKDYDGDGQILFGTDIRSKHTPSSYTEAPWLYRQKDEDGNYYGNYYLFYAHGWREDMAYAILDGEDLMNDDFFYEEVIMEHSATSNTNHMAVVDFLGKTWFIYHNGSLPHGSGFRRVACIEELKFDEDGYVQHMEETAAGPFGTASTITALNGEVLQHAPFKNSGADDDYPYKDIALGTFDDAADLDGQWVIVAGKASPDDPYTVSIVSQNKAGLYISANEAGVYLSQDWDGYQSNSMTFKTVAGLAGEGVSFESVVTPGQYLTLSGGALTLSDGADVQAASFLVETVQ